MTKKTQCQEAETRKTNILPRAIQSEMDIIGQAHSWKADHYEFSSIADYFVVHFQRELTLSKVREALHVLGNILMSYLVSGRGPKGQKTFIQISFNQEKETPILDLFIRKDSQWVPTFPPGFMGLPESEIEKILSDKLDVTPVRANIFMRLIILSLLQGNTLLPAFKISALKTAPSKTIRIST